MPAKKAASAPPMPRGQKLTLSFGLVNVPATLKPLAETQRPIPGKGLCPTHGPVLEQRSHCSVGTDEEHELADGEKVIGYPHPDKPGEYVVVDAETIKQLEESRSGQATIERMVDVGTIDAAYFDKTYLLWPQPGGEQAFDLLAFTLKQAGKAAVVTAVLRKQTQHVVVRWSDEFECMLAHVVRFDTQIRHYDAELVRQAAAARKEPAPEMVAAANALLATLEGEFDASEAQDQLTPLMNDAIRAADKGETYAVAPRAEAAEPVVDLMAALKASIAAKPAPEKKPARKKAAA